MRVLIKSVAVGAVLMMFLAACTGSAREGAGPTDEATAPPETATAVSEAPTATPAPEVTDQDLIDAALAAQEASPAPEGTIAWDVLETDVTEDGTVRFRLCTWDGLTAFDEVRDVRYRTTVADDGAISASNIQDSVASGDCLNTHLIETAVDTVNEWEQFWAEVTGSPQIFATDQRRLELLTEEGLRDHLTLTGQWLADDVYFIRPSLGSVPTDLLAPLAFRFGEASTGEATLAFTTCSAMNPDYGFYRGEALIDDLRPATESGPHSVKLYELIADPTSATQWRLDLTAGTAWADCFRSGSWLDGLAAWQPGTAWQELGEPYAP